MSKLKKQSGKVRPELDEYFLKIAKVVGQRATCLRHNIGAVLVKDKQILSTGYNGAPSGMPDCLELGCIRDQLKIDKGTRHEICRAVHAEQNAIIQAAKHGVDIHGATMYITHSPCTLCAKMMINAGVARVVCYRYYPDATWEELFKLAGIKLEIHDDPELELGSPGERVLTITREHFNKCGSFQGVKQDSLEKYYDKILSGVKYSLRTEAEKDSDLKQIIPQFIVRYKDDYFISKRLDTSDEPRLSDMNYLAFGGHINPVDTADSTGDVIERGAQRELSEELKCVVASRKLIGFVNDEKMEVSKYHLAVLYLVELRSKESRTKENDQYKGFWVNKSDLGQYFEDGDSWSRYMWREFIKTGKI